MVDVSAIKARMKEKKLTVEELSKKICIHPSTMYRKLSLAENFTIGEARNMAVVLGFTAKEAEKIFFA